ncbi:MAG: hypothetical protein MZW92_22670 [Comamonadaceae bacterium]|nr:hypothetical protein [Comamonadaceae bacterium]
MAYYCAIPYTAVGRLWSGRSMVYPPNLAASAPVDTRTSASHVRVCRYAPHRETRAPQHRPPGELRERRRAGADEPELPGHRRRRRHRRAHLPPRRSDDPAGHRHLATPALVCASGTLPTPRTGPPGRHRCPSQHLDRTRLRRGAVAGRSARSA